MRPRILTALLTAALGIAAAAPAAHAQDPNNPVLDDIQQDGVVNNPCRYNPEQLRQGLSNLPPDAQQYGNVDVVPCGGPAGAPQQAQQQQVDVNGEPLIGQAGQGGPPAPPAATQVEVADPPGPRADPVDALAHAASPAITARPGGSNVPWWLPLLGLLALAGGLAFLLSRQRGWSADRFTQPLKASMSEAGGRTADGAAEVWDWMRLGR